MSSIAELEPCGPQEVMIWVPWKETRSGAAAARSSQVTADGESSRWPEGAGVAAAGRGRPKPISAVPTRTASRERLTAQRPVSATGCSVGLSPA